MKLISGFCLAIFFLVFNISCYAICSQCTRAPECNGPACSTLGVTSYTAVKGVGGCNSSCYVRKNNAKNYGFEQDIYEDSDGVTQFCISIPSC